MDGIYIGLYILIFVDLAATIYILNRLRRTREHIYEIKKACRELLSRSSIPLLEDRTYKKRSHRSEKASLRMKEMWKKIKESQDRK